jgi:predicted aconitase
MKLTSEEQDMLAGGQGRSARKAMEILVALGKIYGASELVPVSSVQVAGVSYDNLGEAGLAFLDDLAEGGGRARVFATLNPAGMDVENWQVLGIPPEFAEGQLKVLAAFTRMGIVASCTCTPYLAGNLPLFGQHIAWAESSAVCFANSALGARTNREGGPSALAAAITGRTAAYGYHLDENRQPSLTVEVAAALTGTSAYGALGAAIGRRMEKLGSRPVPYITGISDCPVESMKALCASIATYGGAALFHIEGVTPEAGNFPRPDQVVRIEQDELDEILEELCSAEDEDIDFVSLGCPHLSLEEVARIAARLEGCQVKREFWITTSRPVRHLADRMGYTELIEKSGARLAVDTCCVVAPIKGRFRGMATDSAKACYYAAAKNRFKTRLLSFEEVIQEALR